MLVTPEPLFQATTPLRVREPSNIDHNLCRVDKPWLPRYTTSFPQKSINASALRVYGTVDLERSWHCRLASVAVGRVRRTAIIPLFPKQDHSGN